ncbi:sugar ABC transporter permease [Nakamurella flavida]|uniref:Sugar ABC transporter permease n=1 Tax=Nakamurella flavida TaxID=363630 RepID=A0A938YMA5_9ACTN|nr:sugar ABC transporter permease [Nakamurella flavida]MBM9475849.1 sugar ABC transporter permease [Nakamurella flavida]MDP9777867.1 sorbitol/mannitol transport system permease protein [Nakamurella flavida]
MTATTVDDPAARHAQKAAKKEGWVRRGPLLPALIFTIVMTQLPFVATLVISFLDWQAYSPDTRSFAGFDNFVNVFKDSGLRQSVFTTILLTVTVVLVSLVLGLGIALLLNRKFIGRGIVRTLMITPFLVVPVAAALFFKHGIFNPTSGLINGVISWIWGLFGDTTPPVPVWLTEFPLISVEIQLIWQWTPFMTLILLAGLQSRPGDVLEAAAVDGASPWQTFANITMPHMRQYLELAGLLGTIYIVQNFDSVFTITSGSLGTANLPYTIYTTVFNAQDYGLASAQGVIVVIGSIIIATFALRTVSSLFREESTR